MTAVYESTPAQLHNRVTLHLYVPGPFLSLVGHPLLDAGQFLFQISHLMLVKLGQIIQLVF